MDELISREVLNEIIFLIRWSLSIWAKMKINAWILLSTFFHVLVNQGARLTQVSLFCLNQNPNESSRRDHVHFAYTIISVCPQATMQHAFSLLFLLFIVITGQQAICHFFVCKTLIMQQVRAMRIKYYKKFKIIRTCKSWFIKCEGWSERNLIFKHSELIRSFPLHVRMWVCPWVRLSIFWPAERDARAHLLHRKCETVRGTSGHTVESWNF